MPKWILAIRKFFIEIEDIIRKEFLPIEGTDLKVISLA
jgi:hypothetical protein